MGNNNETGNGNEESKAERTSPDLKEKQVNKFDNTTHQECQKDFKKIGLPKADEQDRYFFSCGEYADGGALMSIFVPTRDQKSFEDWWKLYCKDPLPIKKAETTMEGRIEYQISAENRLQLNAVLVEKNFSLEQKEMEAGAAKMKQALEHKYKINDGLEINVSRNSNNENQYEFWWDNIPPAFQDDFPDLNKMLVKEQDIKYVLSKENYEPFLSQLEQRNAEDLKKHQAEDVGQHHVQDVKQHNAEDVTQHHAGNAIMKKITAAVQPEIDRLQGKRLAWVFTFGGTTRKAQAIRDALKRAEEEFKKDKYKDSQLTLEDILNFSGLSKLGKHDASIRNVELSLHDTLNDPRLTTPSEGKTTALDNVEKAFNNSAQGDQKQKL